MSDYTIFGTDASDPGARGDDIGFVLILGTAAAVALVSYLRPFGPVGVAEDVTAKYFACGGPE